MTEIVENIRTRQIEICNSEGGLGMLLKCESDGAPYIRLYDSKGRERIVLSLNSKEEPQIGLLHEDGPVIVGLGVNERGGGINIFDRSGKEMKIHLNIDEEGNPSIETC